MISHKIPKEGICSLCGGRYTDHGNNPWPLGAFDAVQFHARHRAMRRVYNDGGTVATSTAHLCDRLVWLRSRYDAGAVAPAVYGVIKKIEVEIAWREHAKLLRAEEGVR